MDSDANDSLLDMLEFGTELVTFASGRDTERDDIERMRYLAIERLLELVGEALGRAVRVEPGLATEIPDVSDIRGMRHRLAHDYDGIKFEVVWDSAENDVPDLMRVITNILRERGAI